jgi:serine/threonine protein kinase/Tfp pilus assembly protein PilF
MIGSTISHYRITEKLGEGGMGIVYKAEDLRLKRTVALKFLPERLADSREDLIRFQQEAEALSALNHPSIATIFDLEESGDKKFISIEFIAGGTLKDRIEKEISAHSNLPITEIIEYGIQIAEGLDHAHRKGILHRDIKSDNIMFNEEGRIKITDFGLARFSGGARLTRTGSTLGTLAYMSPEQLRGEEIDSRADLFSFGVALYESAANRLPFRGEHEAAMTYSIAHEPPIALHSVRPDLPEQLERLIMKMLAKDRSERYQSAHEIAAELKRLQRGEALQMTPSPPRISVRGRWILAGIVVALTALALDYFLPRAGTDKMNVKSIAVLPFINLSGNAEDEYFTDGVTEDILTQLSKIADLDVISRTTMMQYKGSKKSLREIGHELKASVILGGSIRHAGSRIRIVGQLNDANSDREIWAETYDRELKDVFEVQSDVARKIAAALEARLSPAERANIEKRSTSNTDAYDLYLRGRYFWNKRSAEGLMSAISSFEAAVRVDSTFAQAYAGLADSYILLGAYDLRRPEESFPAAKAYAEKALAIDNSLGEAYASLGDINTHYFWNFPEAERNLRRAIELSPRYGTAYQWMSEVMQHRLQFDSAIAYSRRALDLEPYSLIFNVTLGELLARRGEFEKSADQLRKALDFDSTFAIGHYEFGVTLVGLKKYEDAAREFRISAALIPSSQKILAALCFAEGMAGHMEEARDLEKRVQSAAAKEYVPSYDLAVVALSFGDKGRAVGYLNRSVTERGPFLPFINSDPLFISLRNEPEFASILERIR